ncbi:MAG: dephospho-CoA kinase [Eubacteriaceae bacterium]|nr:dephospho-CoA kinase [Eubacteriaceae bacterium]
MMIRIGVTGGTGSGKSTFAKYLAEYLDCPVIDADVLSRRASADKDVLEAIRTTFGDEYIAEDGSMDRKKMGALVFSDDASREKLNGIIHPEVRRMYFRDCARFEEDGEAYVIYDCPLLFECGLQGDVDKTVLVYTDDALRRERIMARDSLTYEQAESRMASQMDQDEKLPLANIVVYNDSSLSDLEKAAELTAQEIKNDR